MRGRKPSRSPQKEKLDVDYVEEAFLNNHRLVFNGGGSKQATQPKQRQEVVRDKRKTPERTRGKVEEKTGREEKKEPERQPSRSKARGQ